MKSSRLRHFIVAVAVLIPAALASQAPPPQDRIAALKQSLAANQKALRQYSWVETTTTTMKGEVKKQEQKQCSYGPDGKVQKTPAAGAPEAKPQSQPKGGGGRRGGRMKEKIVENKVDELKDYMERAAAVVHEYVPPDPDKIQAAQAASHVSAQPAGNTTTFTILEYLKPGDAVTIGLDTVAGKLTQFNVKSYVDKPKDDDLTLAVTFARLEDGTSYPQQILLDVIAKEIQVKVVNSGYKKAAQ